MGIAEERAGRRGEKLGWTFGWTGGFLWLALLSGVWLVQGRTVEGLAGGALFLAAMALVAGCAPWKHPRTKNWKLMLPVYAAFFLSVLACIRLHGGFEAAGIRWWVLLAVLAPTLLPFATAGNRTWLDEGKQGDS